MKTLLTKLLAATVLATGGAGAASAHDGHHGHERVADRVEVCHRHDWRDHCHRFDGHEQYVVGAMHAHFHRGMFDDHDGRHAGSAHRRTHDDVHYYQRREPYQIGPGSFLFFRFDNDRPRRHGRHRGGHRRDHGRAGGHRRDHGRAGGHDRGRDSAGGRGNGRGHARDSGRGSNAVPQPKRKSKSRPAATRRAAPRAPRVTPSALEQRRIIEQSIHSVGPAD